MSLRARMKFGLARRAQVKVTVLAGQLLLLLFTTAPVCAQLHSLDVSQYLHTSWTAQDGYFPGIGIGNAMAQTPDGYIWILSTNGLLRFDGERFTEWKPPQGESLPGKPPAVLLVSRNGSLWLAGHGVAELRKDGAWHRYRELDSSSLVTLAEGKNGVIWAGVGGRPTPNSCSLFRIDHGKVECYRRPEFAGLSFSSVYVDRKGRLWADSKLGIWRILPGPPELMQKTTLRVAAFCEGPRGSLLYTSNGPIWKLSRKGRSEDYLGKVDGIRINGRAMLRDREGGLWIGTSGEGIVHLHDGRVDHYSSSDGLSSDFIEGLFQDREGNVWAMSPYGIDKFTKPAVPRLTRKERLSSDSVLSVFIDRRGRTWVGTDNGLNELVGDHFIQPSLHFHNRPGLALLETHKGRLLIATIDRDNTNARNYKHLVPDGSSRTWLEGYKTVFEVAEDGKYTLWVASRELGLLHVRENGDLIKAFSDERFGSYPISVAFDPTRGGIWFTTHQGDLLFLKGGKILKRYGLADGLGYGPVRVLRVDKDGSVWLATKVGLAHLAHGKISLLGRKNGLPCDALHWMRRDQDHNVWLYTQCGLVSFSEADLLSWIAQPSHVVTITHYLDDTEGVESDANGGWFTPQTAMTKDGRILFAMRTGLGVLDPRHLNQNPFPPPVHIEEITADGRKIQSSGPAVLPAHTAVIRIMYTALSFSAPRKIRFRYRLQKFDKTWSPLVSLREATYTNLPPGNYRFQVIACNNDGVWNNEGATLNFVVLPAWYQMLWFKVVAVVAILAVLVAFYRRRVSLIEREMTLRFSERMTERMRIARELHDTLLQAMQGLVLSISNFSSQAVVPPEVREEMDRSLDRADRLLISGRDRIRDLRGEGSQPETLMTALHAIAAEIFGAGNSKVEMVCEGTVRPLDSFVREEVLMIASEALANASLYSQADAIEVQTWYQSSEFRISVRDDGIGFDVDAVPEGHFGIRGMRERAEAMGARLDIRSVRGDGTEIRVVVPAERAYEKKKSWLQRFLRRVRS